MIPPGYLCPPIPGRADYVHHLADLIGEAKCGVRVIDVGTGANCIYPIIGSQSYGWKFVASEIDPISVKAARAIVGANPSLSKLVRIVHQKNRRSILNGVIKPSDQFDAVMCNPPFHDSPATAELGTTRKLRNLNKGNARSKGTPLNFGGQQAELWCDGGEIGFIKQMIVESATFGRQVGWFTSLVSKSERLPVLHKMLVAAQAEEIQVVPMNQGNKQSRLIAWRFNPKSVVRQL